MIDGKANWIYRRSQNPEAAIRISDPNRLSSGDHVVAVKFDYAGKDGEVGRGGTYTLTIDDRAIASTRIDRTVPYIYSVDETLDIGEDHGTPIIEDYADRMPFMFDGKIDSVAIDLGPMQIGKRSDPEKNDLE